MKHLHWAKFDAITIPPDRLRKLSTPEKNEELAASIKSIGLLHLPTLYSSDLVLVSGYRRLLAMQYLHETKQFFRYIGMPVPEGEIPHQRFEELSEEDALEIELQENTMREDLTWQEKAQATARLHELYKKRNPKWTLKQTTEMSGMKRQGTVSDRIVLAEHLDDPEIAKAPSEQAGMQLLRKKLEREFREKMESVVALPSIDLREEGAIEGLAKLPNESVNTFLTDPPYGIGAHHSGLEKASYKDDSKYVRKLLSDFAPLSFQKAAKQAHLFAFCSIVHYDSFRTALTKAGWSVWTNPFVWVKDTGIFPDANLGPRHTYELILYANKGKCPVSRQVSDVIEVPSVKDKQHQAQKPVDLYRFFLSFSTSPGNTVCDPFCGSGTIFLAAKTFSLKVIGFEIDEEAIKLARLRWKEQE